jgi:hypothetical protein
MAKLIGNAPNQVPTNADLGSMAFEDRTNYANISSPIYQPYRNIFINGDMSIAQRSTSVASITTTGYYTADRWHIILATLGTWTQSQSTDVPTGQGFATSLKMDCTTADASPASLDRLFVEQKFEGQNLQYLKKGTANAVSTTLSFWVKSNKTGTYITQLYDVNNNRSISKSYTIDSASTWEKKTITFAGDTTGTLGNDNSHRLSARFYLGAGTGWTSGTLGTSWGAGVNANIAVGQVNLADNTANEWYITGVQLEAGTTASDFEFLPYDVNLARCQRYCYSEPPGDANHAVSNGYYGSSTLFITVKELPVSMRANPSLTTTGNWQVSSVANITITSFSLVDNVIKNINAIQIRATVASGGVAGDGGMIRNTDATATFILSSEL